VPPTSQKLPQLPEPLQIWLAPQLVPAATFVPAQVPLPLHTSPDVHALPSLQAVPLASFENAVVDVPGAHCWHWLPGFTAPAA
jgi:hypothetical protein